MLPRRAPQGADSSMGAAALAAPLKAAWPSGHSAEALAGKGAVHCVTCSVLPVPVVRTHCVMRGAVCWVVHCLVRSMLCILQLVQSMCWVVHCVVPPVLCIVHCAACAIECCAPCAVLCAV